jgi:hypothetical protein
MRTFSSILMVNVAALLVVSVTAQQPASKPTSKPTGAAPAKPATTTPAVSPDATVQEIMATMIDPASKAVFGSVGTTETNGVEQNKEPKNDEEWAVVRANAIKMIDGAKLISMPGRRIASAEMSNNAAEGELTPAQIEQRLAKDRASWNRLAREFSAAASKALNAAEAKSPDAVMDSGDAIDTACENCHTRFWYPDQDKLFKK